MTICGGCGIAGVRENNWSPLPHKCPRWDIEHNALQRVANTVAAFIDKENGAITEYHVKMVLENLERVQQKCDELDRQQSKQ